MKEFATSRCELMRPHPNHRFNLRQFADNSYYPSCMVPETRDDARIANGELARIARLNSCSPPQRRRLLTPAGDRVAWSTWSEPQHVWVRRAEFSSVDDQPAEVAG